MNGPEIRKKPALTSLGAVMVWGLAPIVALAVRFDVALWFSLIALCIAFLVTLFIHGIKDMVSPPWHLAWTMVFAALLVTVAEVLCDLFAPALLRNFGVYLPVLAISPLVMLPLEAVDGEATLGERLGLLAAMMGRFIPLMLGIALFREILAAGSVTLNAPVNARLQVVVPGLADAPVGFLATTAGGLVLAGLLLAFRNWLAGRKAAGQPDMKRSLTEAGS
jgi:electron transport complex protein RnfE